MSDSGAPKHWPFRVVEPEEFKIPERAIDCVKTYRVDGMASKERIAEDINDSYVRDGWMGIGYHYVIDVQGNIVTGRALDEIPIAGDIREKKGMLAIAYVASEAAGESLSKLCEAIQEKYRLARRDVKVEHV